MPTFTIVVVKKVDCVARRVRCGTVPMKDKLVTASH